MTKEELIQEAERRGYKTGTLIDYDGCFSGTDTLGSGNFDMYEGKLIKYEDSSSKRFDTIWCPNDGWTKIVTSKHGFAL